MWWSSRRPVLPELEETQREEVDGAVRALLAHGLGGFSAQELATALGAVPRSRGGRRRSRSRSPRRRAEGQPVPSPGTWRNIRYGCPGDRRLLVFEQPEEQSRRVGSIPFGERFKVSHARSCRDELWLQLENHFAGKWVLAESRRSHATEAAVNCAKMCDWKDHSGPIPLSAFRGQEFPQAGMYTEGFAGSQPVCVVSASGDAFWREVNIEMLFRDLATATVFEQQWGGDMSFTDWVAYYATNCVQYGGLRSCSQKALLVIVKPTSRWRDYGHVRRCFGPCVESTKDDIGRAQLKECKWLYSMTQRLEFDWDEVEFVTAFVFLMRHCHWSPEDCRRAALEKADLALEISHCEDHSGCRHHFALAYWCCDEAFREEPWPPELCLTLAKVLLRIAATVPDAEGLGWPLPGVVAHSWRHLASVAISFAASQLHEPGFGTLAAAALVRMDRGELAECAATVAEHLQRPEHCARTNAMRVLDHIGHSAPRFFRRATHHRLMLGRGIYLLGGCVAATEAEERVMSAAERFDPDQRAWSAVAPMRTARQFFAACVLSGKLYALGGRDGDTVLSAVECFDPASRSWSASAPMHEPRSDFAAAVFERSIFALGGYDGRSSRGETAERFTPSESGGVWIPIGSMDVPRTALAAAAFQGAVYAIGGYGCGYGSLAAVEGLDPARGVWQRMGNLCAARAGLAAVVSQGQLFAVGGKRAHASRSLERFVAPERRWEAVASSPALPDQPVSAVAFAGAIYVFGADFASRYEEGREWQTLPAPALSRAAAAVGVLEAPPGLLSAEGSPAS